MIATLLSGAEALPESLAGKVDYLIVDRMNYHYADWIYRKLGMEEKLKDEYFINVGQEILSSCRQMGIDCELVF